MSGHLKSVTWQVLKEQMTHGLLKDAELKKWVENY